MIYFLFNLKQEFSVYLIIDIICSCIINSFKDDASKEECKRLLNSKKLHYDKEVEYYFRDLMPLEKEICNTKRTLRENSTITITKQKLLKKQQKFMLQYLTSIISIIFCFLLLFIIVI